MAASRRNTFRSIDSSKLTSKCQATVPLSVRKRLNLKAGDTVVFEESQDGTICIRKAEPLDLEFFLALEHTFSEWTTDNDEHAYRDL
jgi:antitoxin PrlF